MYATIEDVEALFRPLSNTEKTKSEALIEVIEASLAVEAAKVGKDLDVLAQNPAMKLVIKSVVVDVLARTLMTPTDQPPMTQMTQTAGGYSFSGTFLTPGGGLFIKKSELAKLGLKRQRMRMVEPYDMGN